MIGSTNAPWGAEDTDYLVKSKGRKAIRQAAGAALDPHPALITAQPELDPRSPDLRADASDAAGWLRII